MNKTYRTGVSTVTCVQASQCFYTGKKIFTLELEYPRAIHAQLLTHGVFSKNSSSTRAVPLEAAIKQLLANPAQYIWTENQAGMQGAVITDPDKLAGAERLFHIAKDNMISIVRNMASKRSWGQNIHKQNAGRLLEPFQNIKIVLTSTEWENWDWLRNDPDAQGEIADLARNIKQARDEAEVMILKDGEWHVPYVERERSEDGSIYYYIKKECATADWSMVTLTPAEAKEVSSSVCAQISYRKADYALEKASKMKGMLIDGRKVHASPFEHQATPIKETCTEPNNPVNDPRCVLSWEEGVTHLRRDGTFGSGNFVGFVQHRQLVPKHDKALFDE